MENEELKEVREDETRETEVSQEEKVEAIFSDYVMKLPNEKEEEEEAKPLEPNKPAYWSQRIAAGLIDLCILFLATWGLFRLFLLSGLGDSLREESATMQEVIDYYKTEPMTEDGETYGYKLYSDEDGYDNPEYQNYTVYTEPETNKDYKVIDYETVTDACKEAYQKAVKENSKYKNASFNYQFKNYGIVVLAGSIAEVVFLLAIPLTNKSRASLGKLAAGLMVINKKYQVEARWYQMVGRLLWTLSIESALPLLFLKIGNLSPAISVMLIVPPILFLITLINKDRCTLHDFVARTRVIDKRTYLPMTEQ